MTTYIYQPEDRIAFAEGLKHLAARGHRVIPHGVDITSPATVAEIRALGSAAGLDFRDYIIDVAAFREYVAAAGYADRYQQYYVGNQVEKSLEHFIALTLLKLTSDDVFIDIASEHSPVPEIYARITGARTYGQDIMYPAGLVGDRIGGDACAMPVADGFASAATLTCSLEHFEEDADSKLFVELARVLRPGGRVCVVPFYVNIEPVTQTDPTVGVPAQVVFDAGPIYCAEGWGNRHARFYSPQSFADRIIGTSGRYFDFEFYCLKNAAEIGGVYARFAFLATRR